MRVQLVWKTDDTKKGFVHTKRFDTLVLARKHFHEHGKLYTKAQIRYFSGYHWAIKEDLLKPIS